MLIKKKRLENWSVTKSINSVVFCPNNIIELKNLVKKFIRTNKKFSVMGNGNTYGDTFLNSCGRTIDLSSLNKILKISYRENFVEAEAGVRMSSLLNILIPKKRIINNLPGSHKVTLGGCIGSNVHGKDSFRSGTFGNNIISIKIIDHNGDIKNISRKNINFKKYIGSFGANCIIISAVFKINKIQSSSLKVETIKFNSIKELLNLFEKNKNQAYYMGAWINHFSKNGEGIFKKAEWNKNRNLYSKIFKDYSYISQLIIKILYPIIKYLVLNRLLIKIINKFLLIISKNKIQKNIQFKNFYFPQEKYIPKHSKLFLKGKINIQLLIPKKNFETHFKNIAILCKKYKFESWWMGIKKHKKTKFLHTFSLDGFDLTLQWSRAHIKKQSFNIFYKNLIEYISNNKILVYHSKDILLNRKNFLKLSNSKAFDKYYLSRKNIFNNLLVKRLGKT